MKGRDIMTIGGRIVALWVSFLNALHLYTRKQLQEHIDREANATKQLMETLRHLSSEESARLEITSKYKDLQERIIKAHEEAQEALADRDALRGDLDKLNADVDTKNKTILLLGKRVDEMREAASTNNEFVKEVQKQLGLALESSKKFGFPDMIAIPGSTSFDTSFERNVNGEGFAVVRGRSVLSDDMTQKIDGTPSVRERMNMIIDYMSRYGVLEQIVKGLINYGALSITLAYNTHCTAYEIYYESVSKVYNDDSIFVIRNDTVDVNTTPEETTEEQPNMAAD